MGQRRVFLISKKNRHNLLWGGELSGWFNKKESTCNARDMGSIPGLRRSLGEGHSNPLQCSCLGNPVNRGACWATVHGVAESRTSDRAWMHALWGGDQQPRPTFLLSELIYVFIADTLWLTELSDSKVKNNKMICGSGNRDFKLRLRVTCKKMKML